MLVVLRHGRAESFSEDDHDRRLTDRGRRDATAAGEWLEAQGLAPSYAFVSSAVRARDTWEAAVQGAGWTLRGDVQDAVYSADPDSATDVLRTAPSGAEVVLYVGHNPTAASLAHLLDDGTPDVEAFRSLSEGFPPAAVAVLDVEVPWADLGPGTAHLRAFHGQG